MTIKELLAARAAKLAEANTIRTTAAADDGRDLTEAEVSSIETLVTEARALKTEADTKAATGVDQLMADLDADLADVATVRTPRAAGKALPDAAVTSHQRSSLMDDPNRQFSCLGEQAQAIVSHYQPGSLSVTDRRLAIMAAEGDATGQSAGVGAEGGFLLAPSFNTAIWDGMREEPASLLAMCDQYTVPPGMDSLSFNANAETSRVTGSRYGGVQGYWKSEVTQMAASKPKLRQVKGEPQELYVLCYATNKLIRAGAEAALTQWLTRAAVSEILVLTNDAIFDGSGAGKPKGLLKSTGCIISVAKESGQLADTIVTRNLQKMWKHLPANRRGTAVWLLNQEGQDQLDDLAHIITDVAGTENVGGFRTGIYNPDRHTIKGRPVVDIEQAKKLGDRGDIVLADMQGYAAFTRGGIEQAMSIHLRFDYAETAFRFIFEVDGQPWLKSAITPMNANTGFKITPFVTLDARA